MSSFFEYHVNNSISQLAWCVVLEENKKAQVYCGKSVECMENAFVEGAWNGEFSEMCFDQASFFCGSGAKYVDEKYIFSTASHVLEKIVLVDKNQLYISNSVPFVLAMSKCSLDMHYTRYESDFCSIVEGLDRYKRMIPLADNFNMHCYYYCNILIDKKLNIFVEDKMKVKEVIDYNDYYNSLCFDMEMLSKNAKSLERKKKYGIVTTISKGYDATACSVVAKEIGCDTAVSFNQPDKYAVDCGSEIAFQLGFSNIVLKDADLYKKRIDFIEAEHVCSGELGTTIIFSAFEEEFKDNLVFYGERGDKIWDKNYSNPNDRFEFKKEITAGISMCESRLRVGFILVPMPLYKAATWTSIHKLSNSVEMSSFSLGNNYDRPIPRRIVEEKGVKRETFGQQKKGAGINFHFDNLSRLKLRMSPSSFESLKEYISKNRRKKQLIRIIRYYASTLPTYLNWGFNKMKINFRIKNKEILIDNPGAVSYLINWGMDIMISRYKI